jgi:hypothetical protein
MFIEFSDHRLDRKLTKMACKALEFPYKNQGQFYDGPLEPIEV